MTSENKNLPGGLRSVEKSVLAYDLHNGLGQELAAIRLRCDRLSSHLSKSPHMTDLKGMIEQAQELSQGVAASIGWFQSFLFRLQPDLWIDIGFVKAIQKLVRVTEEQSKLKCRLTIPKDLEPHRERALEIFHLCQDILTQAVSRHRPTQLGMKLAKKGRAIRVECVIGQNMIANMAELSEWVESIGGKTSVTSSKNGRTKIICELGGAL